MRIVIIGAVATGLKAASKARRCDPHAQITVIEKGELISYGACGMPYYVGGEIDEIGALSQTGSGSPRNPDYFKNVKDVTVLNQVLATKINRAEKSVSVRHLFTGEEECIPYDKLVIATGALPLKPQWHGSQLANIFSLWHPDDAKAIRQGLEKRKFTKAVIVGSGLIGMEMVEALATWGLEVTVVEMKDQILPALLDADMAGLVAKYLREKGIQVLTGTKVTGFTGSTAVTGVQAGQLLPADLVILGLGVRPNVTLAEECGLTIGVTGAIVVNEQLTTSDPDIFAGGDCVENTHLITGGKVFTPMGSTANKQGRVIGENLCGGQSIFRGVLTSAVVRVMEQNVGKTGITAREAQELGMDYVSVVAVGLDKPHYMPEAEYITIKLLANPATRKVLGIQAVGKGDVAKRLDVAAAVLTLGGTIDDLFAIDMTYAPPYNSPIDNLAVAANVLMNKLAGSFAGISATEAQKLLAGEKVTFLDVRSPGEYEQAKLVDSSKVKNIPLGQLRSRCQELSPDDEIVAYCRISQRGYEAAGILKGQDFKKVKILEGGMVAWPFAEDEDHQPED